MEQKTNVFYHGDCLLVMQHDIQIESVDLIYLDPPFYTGVIQKGLQRNNKKVLYKDRWKPGAMEVSYEDSKNFWKEKGFYEKAPEWMKYIAIEQPAFASYLYYMMERLQECKKILKSTGSGGIYGSNSKLKVCESIVKLVSFIIENNVNSLSNNGACI